MSDLTATVSLSGIDHFEYDDGAVLDRIDLTNFKITSFAHPETFLVGGGRSLWDVAAIHSGLALAAMRYLGISTLSNLAKLPVTTLWSPIDERPAWGRWLGREGNP